MKKIIHLAIFAPGAALAHGGHPELPGAAGHDLAHAVLALGLAGGAVALVAALRVRAERTPRRQEE